MRAWIVALLTASLVMIFPATSGAFLLEPSPAALFVAREGSFTSGCGYSHRLPDDPIVKPNQPGASHSHDFFGARSTNAFSTYDTLRASSTTCSRASDTAAYWVPTLYENGIAVRPSNMRAYYTARGKSALAIKPFPAGLRIVAGNAQATGQQKMMVVTWTCGESSSESSSVPLCAFRTLQLHIRFPDCWDGKNLDFLDHKSHMAYSNYGTCPTGYGIELPGLQMNVAYPVNGGPGISLASGPAYTAHADFLNSWNQADHARLVRDCLNLSRTCG